jgi:hypothetical protein
MARQFAIFGCVLGASVTRNCFCCFNTILPVIQTKLALHDSAELQMRPFLSCVLIDVRQITLIHLVVFMHVIHAMQLSSQDKRGSWHIYNNRILSA